MGNLPRGRQLNPEIISRQTLLDCPRATWKQQQKIEVDKNLQEERTLWPLKFSTRDFEGDRRPQGFSIILEKYASSTHPWGSYPTIPFPFRPSNQRKKPPRRRRQRTNNPKTNGYRNTLRISGYPEMRRLISKQSKSKITKIETISGTPDIRISAYPKIRNLCAALRHTW